MSTNNPFAKHTSTMFASRGCDIDEALVYANDVISAMPVEVQSHAMTALMVVVNTAANAFTQATGPSPEKIAIMELINQITREHINNALNDLDEQVENKVSAWMENNLDNKLDDWANNWIENNFDVDNSIVEWMNEYLESHLESAINDMDLVVRVR